MPNKNVLIIIVILIIGAVGFFFAYYESAVRGQSGQYGDFALGVNHKTGEITGYYISTYGWDDELEEPRYICNFLLYGKKQGRKYNVRIWHPELDEIIDGVLVFKKIDKKLNMWVRFEDYPIGSGHVYLFDTDDGDDFELKKAGNWNEVRLVKAKKAYIYDQPDDSVQAYQYVLEDNLIEVFKREEGWVQAGYGGNSKVRGWVKEEDLYPIYPTK